MARTQARGDDTRERLIDAAARLAHLQGFHRTSLADVAKQSGVPVGNVYYHFKTKEALGKALIDKLATTAAMVRSNWDRHADATTRIEAFIDATVQNKAEVARHGCAIGTLCTDLRKGDGPLLEQAATLFGGLLEWLEENFRRKALGNESRDLALHLLSSIQGASLLAQTFKDPRILEREARRLKRWVRSL